ncbi:MAG: hypothetical protein Phyf2KO_03330 [Phycisphaerales bacterium]
MVSGIPVVACAFVAACAQGQQTYLDISIQADTDPGGGTYWTGIAELINPAGTVLATISDIGYRLTASNIGGFTYNDAFDSDFFGPASVAISGDTVEFLGSNTVPPLNNAGGPDSSNPLELFRLEADQVLSFELIGQITGAYAGEPFPVMIDYTNVKGGDVPYRININPPVPGTTLLTAFAVFCSSRRRR